MEWAEKLGLLGMPLYENPALRCDGKPPRRVGTDTYFAETGKNFIVFNDQELSLEPVGDGDIARVEMSDHCIHHCASEAWSTDCEWFFIVLPQGIALVHVRTLSGFLCRKKSAAFIEAFLNVPLKGSRSQRRTL
jgi:hypothetical protein